MFSPPNKLLLSPLLSVALVVSFLASGFVQPAYCESPRRAVFYSYIRTLYYATKLKQVSKFWIKNARVPMDECLGQAAVDKLAELKRCYVANPQIHSEVVDGNQCTMKGTGIAQGNGQLCHAQLSVIMAFEEGSWKLQYYTWQGEIRGNGY